MINGGLMPAFIFSNILRTRVRLKTECASISEITFSTQASPYMLPIMSPYKIPYMLPYKSPIMSPYKLPNKLNKS